MRKHSSQEILDAAVDVAIDQGLSRLSFGRVAKRLRTSDRMVVYYFPTKPTLVAAVALRVEAKLTERLQDAVGNERLPPEELGRRAWRTLARAAADPYVALHFELVGLGASETPGFAKTARTALTRRVGWVARRLDAPDPSTEAAALLAGLEGCLMVRHMVSPEMGLAAARRSGFA